MADDYTPHEVATLLQGGDVQLIDVRAEHEYAAGHIGASRLIELQNLGMEVASIDRGRPVVLCCRSGGRSAMATAALEQAGFDAHNMSGGMLEWHAAGLPIEPAGGLVAEP